MSSAVLGFSYISVGQSQKEITANTALGLLDALASRTALDVVASLPQDSNGDAGNDGDVYIRSSDGAICIWLDDVGAYTIIYPNYSGFTLYVVAAGVDYRAEVDSNGVVWAAATAGDVGTRKRDITSATYDPVLADANAVIRGNHSTGIVVSVPEYEDVAFQYATTTVQGVTLTFRQVGAGPISLIAGGTSIILNVPEGFEAETARQHCTIGIHHVDANEWDVFGDLRPASP